MSEQVTPPNDVGPKVATTRRLKLVVKRCLRCRVNFWADKTIRVCNDCRVRR